MMRLPSVLNWTLLCMNTVLCILLVLASSFSAGWIGSNSAAHPLPANVAALGLDVYFEKDPFVLLSGKDFPHTESFMLVQRDRPLSMSVLDADGMGPATKSASVGLGPDFSLSCDYSLAGNNARVHQLMLCHRKEGLLETLIDLNADGVFDLRSTRNGERTPGRVCVSYQGAWREVDQDPKQDEFHKQLLDGTRVSFDIQSGQWLSATEKPATGNNQTMPQ